MSDSEVQSRYRLRGQTVELAYADSKHNRRLDRFHGRGIDRVRAETGLMVVAQNLLSRSSQTKPPNVHQNGDLKAAQPP